jgi:murein DD-endopeptidase MepM/ murein hydrolase activator NlpD
MNKYSLPVPKKMVDIRPAPFHKTHASMRYCVDFALPVGTPVKAVAAGRVLYTEGRYHKGYPFKKYADRCNYVGIKHSDGRVSLYVHLQWHSVKVRAGQTVRRGQVIALSGQTGYATYPHLHFGLYLNGNNVPVKFTGYRDS